MNAMLPLVLALATPSVSADTLPTKEVLTLRAARSIADAAEAEALRRGATVAASPSSTAAMSSARSG